ncbi:hypothetical protein J7K60_05435, partial [Candidatus Bipolaricaulota bacterium]|nr:hypothetical protein [Candidatus Bipolaricaulota bacterium]
TYMMPIFMAVFLYNFPAGLWFYYLLTTVFQVGQQYFVNWEMAKAEATTGGTIAEIVEDDEPEQIEEETGDDHTDREDQ